MSANFATTEAKRTETDLKMSQICPIWGQSEPFWIPNLTSVVLSDSQRPREGCQVKLPIHDQLYCAISLHCQYPELTIKLAVNGLY